LIKKLVNILILANLLLVLTSYLFNKNLNLIYFGALFILIILDLLIEFKFKNLSQNPSGLTIGSLTTISGYFVLSNLKPYLASALDPVFWSLFFIELATQFLILKKFKQTIIFRPYLIRFFNYSQSFVFLFLLLTDFKEFSFWFILISGAIANLDLLLILKLMPFYKPGVNSSFEAYKIKKEYNNVYNRN
jgi:hypothetical protein